MIHWLSNKIFLNPGTNQIWAIKFPLCLSQKYQVLPISWTVVHSSSSQHYQSGHYFLHGRILHDPSFWQSKSVFMQWNTRKTHLPNDTLYKQNRGRLGTFLLICSPSPKASMMSSWVRITSGQLWLPKLAMCISELTISLSAWQEQRTMPQSLPGSTLHLPVPLMMHKGVKPQSSVVDRSSTSAPSLTSKTGASAGWLCRAGCQPGDRIGEELSLIFTLLSHFWVEQQSEPRCPPWSHRGGEERGAC